MVIPLTVISYKNSLAAKKKHFQFNKTIQNIDYQQHPPLSWAVENDKIILITSKDVLQSQFTALNQPKQQQ